MDDVFILVEKIEHVGKFKEYLNSKHQNINFTSEIECDGKMPFLDNLIDRKGGKFITVIMKQDKGIGVVLMDRTKYRSHLNTPNTNRDPGTKTTVTN